LTVRDHAFRGDVVFRFAPALGPLYLRRIHGPPGSPDRSIAACSDRRLAQHGRATVGSRSGRMPSNGAAGRRIVRAPRHTSSASYAFTPPLPTVVLDALAAHLAAYPPLGDGFVFVTEAGNPIRRTAFGVPGVLPSRRRVRHTAPASTRTEALLRQPADQTRRERQNGASTARPRECIRDARHAQPPLAR
jgi:hypothetical protein